MYAFDMIDFNGIDYLKKDKNLFSYEITVTLQIIIEWMIRDK